MSTKTLNSNIFRVLAATAFFGVTSGIMMSVMNNYLSDVHHLDASLRGWLELPRELPGFLMIFIISGMLLFLHETQMASFAMIFSVLGTAGMALYSPGFFWIAMFSFIWSLGDHVIFVVEGPIGLKLSKQGKEGKRLGQLGGARNLGIIVGVSSVFLISKLIGVHFTVFF